MSLRLRELTLLLVAALVGAVGALTVAAARADEIRLDPLPVVLALVGVFGILHLLVRRRLPYADPYLLPIVALLVAIGLVELYRVDADLARDQALWVGVGAAVFCAVLILLPDHRVLERFRYVIGLAGVLLLVAVMVFGQDANGTDQKLWIPIGGGQTVQLGEIAKVLVVIFLAAYLRERREVLAIPTSRHLGISLPPIRHLGPLLVFCGAALALAVVLNDFGTALLFFGVFLAMLYVASGRATYVGAGAALFAAGSALVWALVPRLHDRVDSWLRPFDDPQDTGYQMVQSLYALADGGLVGPGFGRAFIVQADGDTVIPALPTDFIFTAIAAELGFVGAVIVIAAFLLLVGRGLAVAARATDGFSKLLATGLVTVIGLQTLVILGGVTRLVPLTGVTLPFMSYGGSSVVTNFAVIALLLVISHRTRAQRRDRTRLAEMPDEAVEPA